MIDQTLGPDTPSSDYSAMADYWRTVNDILGGAVTMRDKRYLPKFEDEGDNDYARRRACAPFTNIYEDTGSNLASKPFSRELTLEEGASDEFLKLSEDIDGIGGNLHNFAKTTFRRGIDKAIEWIWVDHTRVDREAGSKPLSIAEERALGLRPYWVSIPAERVLAAYSERENGREIFVHVRIAEPTIERAGYGETTKNRVRVIERHPIGGGIYGPPTYQLWEKQTLNGIDIWVSIEGPTALSIAEIPLVAFCPTERDGTSWKLKPPLRKIAELQIVEFQLESGLQQALEYTAFPMLGAFGVDLSESLTGSGRLTVGPKALLNSPPVSTGQYGEWKFVEISGDSIKALEAHLDAIQKNMRDLGMQPLTQANLTVITTANVSLKANSAVQGWTLRLKDALEQALKYTAMWLGDVSSAPEVDIFQDFGVNLEGGGELDVLLQAQAQGVLSKKTVQMELKRRSVLSENFDPDDEEKLLAQDTKDAKPAVAVDPATGELVTPPTRSYITTKPGQPAASPTN